MKRSIKTMLAALVMSLSLAVPVVAGPMEDARDAYIRKDYATALRLWLPLAEQGDAQAQSNLGSLYYGGRGVPQDYAKAMKWYRKAAEQGNAKASFLIALSYHLNNSPEPKDQAKATAWFRKAAEQGHAESQVHLGSVYMTGKGAPQNKAEAAKWYRMAGKQGVANAQFALGGIYYYGDGVPQDYVEAHKWTNLAAAQGYKDANELRDFIATLMTPAQLAEAQRLAREWKPKK